MERDESERKGVVSNPRVRLRETEREGDAGIEVHNQREFRVASTGEGREKEGSGSRSQLCG